MFGLKDYLNNKGAKERRRRLGPIYCFLETAVEAGFVLFGEFVFPDAKDAPAGFLQGLGDEAVTGLK